MTSPQPNAKQKRKRCKVCSVMFDQFNSMVAVCSPGCAIKFAGLDEGKAHKQKAVRAETRGMKQALKSRADWIKDAQKAFNKFIRVRDKADGCISCGSFNSKTYMTGSPWDAGHYRSTGSCPELRFEELNCHKQCVKCNRDLSGNVVEYRLRLIKKIGGERMAWLEGPHDAKKYTIDELKEIKAHYKAKVKTLEGRV